MSRKPRGLLSALIVGTVLALGAPALGESGDPFNLHVELGPAFALTGWQAEELGPGLFGGGRLELALSEWIGIEVGGMYLAFFNGQHPEGYEQLDGASMVMAVGGARFRLHNDEHGYLFPWGKKENHAGNLWGNLWFDLHGGYVRTGDLNRFGADVGLGYEFSLVNGLQLGPFARGIYIYQPDGTNERASEDAWILLAGLSFSMAVPPTSMVMFDTDEDGIFNPDDGCPNDPEDKDGFQDEDGCPDKDNDEDGIPDASDGCPDVPEDLDEFEDEDGCPDLDNDEDKIFDVADGCPNDPEDKDGFQDDDGCPDTDNDGDGILDLDDQCPDEAETINGVEDEDGCPDDALVEVKDREILGGERIFFDFGMARVKSKSAAFLQEIVILMKVHPEYTKISIEGNADSVGESWFNNKLSMKRAKRVKQYLVKLGADPNRLEVVGKGESNPWKEGKDKDERALNRRVEFYILEIDEEYLARKRAAKEKKRQEKTAAVEKTEPEPKPEPMPKAEPEPEAAPEPEPEPEPEAAPEPEPEPVQAEEPAEPDEPYDPDDPYAPEEPTDPEDPYDPDDPYAEEAP